MRSVATLPHTPLSVASEDEECEFMAAFPGIVRDLTDADRYLDIPDVTKYYAKVLKYNVPDDRKSRGLSSVLAYRLLTPSELHTPENIRLSHIVGWCIEMTQAFFVMMDDMIDQSITRRGRPCWYKIEGVGINAINDFLLVESGIYQLLRKHVKHQPYYLPLVELFHDITMKTVMGQMLDVMTANTFTSSKLEQYTMEHYTSIVKYKTAYHSFYLPIAAAMYMAGIYDDEWHRQAKTILMKMGHFCQVQNDYLDCFGDPDKSVKIGTDIRDAKCSWLIVIAFQKANAEQKKILEECYGSHDKTKQNRVKEIYKQLGMPATFATFEEETYNMLQTHIQQISCGLSHEVFFKLFEKI